MLRTPTLFLTILIIFSRFHENFFWQEDPDAVSYGDGILDSYDELCAAFGYEVPNGRSHVGIKGEMENNIPKMGLDDMFCDVESPEREFEISDQRKKRKSATSSKSGSSKRVGRIIREEMKETFDEKPAGLANWFMGSEEENDHCSIERIVEALETVPDMNDELFLEACELLEDERKAKMFVAMDVTARKKWLLRKLRR